MRRRSESHRAPRRAVPRHNPQSQRHRRRASESVAAPQNEGLSAAVERHLKEYYAAHKDTLPAAGLYDRVLREVERPLILLTLSATRGNQIKAAQLLGLNRNTLRKKIRELDIEIMRGIR